jgi:hypothetical protein
LIIKPLTALLYRVEMDGAEFLGIRIGNGAARLAPQFASLVNETNLIVDAGGEAGGWQAVGMAIHQDELLMYGPWLAGADSLEKLTDLPVAAGLPRLFACLTAAQALDGLKRLPECGLFLHAWFPLSDGKTLVLAPKIQKLMLSLMRAEQRVAVHDLFQRPGLDPAARMSFGFSVLAFRLMTGRLPYEDTEQPDLLAASQLHGVMRTPRCLDRSVPEAVEEHYQELFQKGQRTVGLGETLEVLRAWHGSAPEGAAVGGSSDAAASKRFTRRLDNLRRRLFLRRNAWKFALAALGIGLVAVIGGTALSNALRPLNTAGMTPEQVVQACYGAVNSLDAEMLKDTLKDDTGKDLVNLVDNLFVISQIRFGTERRNVRMPADQWLSQGSPALAPDLMLFGIGGLTVMPSLEPAGQGESRHFIASYDLYTSAAQDAGPQASGPARLMATIMHREDKLTLKLGSRQTWQIVSIERRETGPETSLEVPAP